MTEIVPLCIVCEQNVALSSMAVTDASGEWFICKDCHDFTVDHAQARAHWVRRTAHRERLRNIEAAAKEAYEHLAFLNENRMLTVGGLIAMESLEKALEKP